MPGAKYAQLALRPEDEVDTRRPQSRCPSLDGTSNNMTLSVLMMLLYFGLSISLTFYQRWLLQGFSFPLTVAMYHLVVKWCLSIMIRTIISLITGNAQLCLPMVTNVRSVAPTGLASGVDVGFSNWGLALVTISLYTMTKSTTIIFILGFAIMLGLERKSWSLVGIVLTISAGLVMFTYKATHFDLLGFFLLLLASLAAGLRWSFAQHLMQKAKLGLHNPIDMVFHVQPWMFVSLLPLATVFEGFDCIWALLAKPSEQMWSLVFKISVGAYIAFLMELSEFLVVTYTSSLTLSIAGIFKEMCILVLAVKINGDQLSPINMFGFVLCLTGITGHVTHKALTMRKDKTNREVINYNKNIKRSGELNAPLLDSDNVKSHSDDSDGDSNNILFEVIQRRDPR